jgi:ABC-type polysaccharide/polyol phosphate transport system ATPase subunit
MRVSAAASPIGSKAKRNPVASVLLESVTLDYPIYGGHSRSFRNAIFGRTGGLIRRDGEHPSRLLVRALEDISFRLEHGDRLGLIGHNGAGKSTLLRVLAGVYAPVSGKIAVEGSISPLFISAPGLDGDDTGYENIRTVGMYLGMSNAEIARKLPEIIEFCELGDYLALPVRTYSAGMMTRLGFAIATAIDPDILLLDEGLATGDARFAQRAEQRMAELIKRSSILVLASHSNAMIRDMCNKGALMEAGRIVQFGPVDEVIDEYQRRSQAANQS